MATVYHSTRKWIKTSDTPLAKFIKDARQALITFDLPPMKAVFLPLSAAVKITVNICSFLTRVFFYTPMFKSQLRSCGKHLFLYGGIPFTAGNLSIDVGNNSRISGRTTFTGRTCSSNTPELIIGNNVDVGWMNTIAVGSKVVLEDNVRLAGQCFLAGYPGHPINPYLRAKGAPELDSQVGDIIIKENAWIATGVTITAGVTIGEGTTVAAGSVVTKSLPPFVIAGGNPAKVIRHLKPSERNTNV